VKDEVDSIATVLQNKLDVIKAEMQKKCVAQRCTSPKENRRRGDAAIARTEVAGGRTVMRMSEIRAATSTDIAQEIRGALDDFFEAASQSKNNKRRAQQAAINGTKNMISAGLDALFGVKSGQSAQVESFAVVFLNNAFVRVDYFAYSYSVSAKAWGEEAKEAGASVERLTSNVAATQTLT